MAEPYEMKESDKLQEVIHGVVQDMSWNNSDNAMLLKQAETIMSKLPTGSLRQIRDRLRKRRRGLIHRMLLHNSKDFKTKRYTY